MVPLRTRRPAADIKGKQQLKLSALGRGDCPQRGRVEDAVVKSRQF